MRTRDSAFAALCLVPFWCTKSESYLECRKRRRASLPVLSVGLTINFKESWYVWIVNRVPFSNGHKSKTNQTMAMYSRYVVLYLRFASVSDRDQYWMGFVVLSCSACNNMHPTWISHASVCRVMCTVEVGSARRGGEMSASLAKFLDFNSLSLRGLNVFGWYFCSVALKGRAMQAKFATNREKISPTPKKGRRSVGLAGIWNL